MRRFVSLLLLVGVLLLTGSPLAWHEEKVIADYGGTSGFQSPLWSAKEGGFFAKYGLDVDIVMIPGGTQSIQALISGGTLISQSSAAAPIHSRLGGSDVVIIATSINDYPFSVVARSGIKTATDLVMICRISKEVDKDWELSAVSKLVFRKIPDERRPALLFENVTGSSVPVVTGVLGASRQVYAIALETELNFEEIFRRWSRAQSDPVAPVLVDGGPCQEVVYQEDEVDLFRLPVPVWTVPHDPAPYFTSPYVIGRDPQTGARNVGTYRLQLKGRRKTGIYFGNNLQDLRRIIDKNGQGLG